MRYFDSHLHFAAPDDTGVDRLLVYLEGEKELMGANLVLNTPREVELADKHRARLPGEVQFIPYYVPGGPLVALSTAGWFKIHPSLHAVRREQIGELVASVADVRGAIRGLMVHHFPWGADIEHNVALPLILALAQAYPDLPVLATHGGGYESWPLRAHTGSLANVFYDFSVTAAYYRGTDYMVPLRQYLEKKQGRVLFGSDWPSAGAGEQLDEVRRLAVEAGMDAPRLEQLLLANAARFWPLVSDR